ncbi:MAG: formate dehydrogenase accessory sulfurtransferase FdhD [Myxococcota bacterium]|nr:formate dehydrogenase accessory sulfurtransferase FdhD [Myxococcota bacterium]
MRSSEVHASTLTVDGRSRAERTDTLAVEEPLEIRLAWQPATGTPRSLVELGADVGAVERPLSITMRTPGADMELALGFLVGEGIVRSRDDVASCQHCGPPVRPDGSSNTVRVTLGRGHAVDLARLERHFYTSSSCGVCGKTSIEAVRSAPHAPLLDGTPLLAAEIIHGLPGQLRRRQEVFQRTGGLHAAGLFDATGHLLALREDVGRHNALDKLVGARLLDGGLPASDHVLLVSGRASFELVQKAVMAGIPVLAAVGAPSSLAVELAREEGMTLLGFVRDGRFNIYVGGHRIQERP